MAPGGLWDVLAGRKREWDPRMRRPAGLETPWSPPRSARPRGDPSCSQPRGALSVQPSRLHPCAAQSSRRQEAGPGTLHLWESRTPGTLLPVGPVPHVASQALGVGSRPRAAAPSLPCLVCKGEAGGRRSEAGAQKAGVSLGPGGFSRSPSPPALAPGGCPFCVCLPWEHRPTDAHSPAMESGPLSAEWRPSLTRWP